MKLLIISIILSLFSLYLIVDCKKPDGEKPQWAKKDIRDYSEADMERLLEQWEVSQ